MIPDSSCFFTTMDIDDSLRVIGEFGRGQVMIVLAVCLVSHVPAAWNVFAIALWGATPEFYCKAPFTTYSFDKPIPFEGNLTDELSRCEQRVNISTNATIECEDGWVYSEKVYGSTIVTQWNLVCSRAVLVPLAQTSYMVGMMAGAVLFGYLADRFGRRPAFFMALLFQGIVGSLQILSPSFTIFCMFRFLSGIFSKGCEIVCYSMVSEWLTPRLRPYGITLGVFLFWAVGVMTLPLIAFVTRDWKYLQLSISIPILFALPLYWFIPESPRWLVTVNRYEEASEIFNRLAKFNGKRDVNIVLNLQQAVKHNVDETSSRENHEKFTDKEEKEASDEEKTTATIKHTSYLDLFRGFAISLVTTTTCTISLLTALCYYGLSFTATRLVGDPYVNFFLNGAVEIPGYIASTLAVVWFGRRRTMCFVLLVAGIACFALSFIPTHAASGWDLTVIIVTTVMIGKSAISASFAVGNLFGTELFPTVLRNKGMALLHVTAHVGGILAPFIVLLGDQMSRLPMILFGTSALFMSMIILPLPEMKGRPQPQTVADLHKVYKEDRANNICFRVASKTKQRRNGEATRSTNLAFVGDDGNQ